MKSTTPFRTILLGLALALFSLPLFGAVPRSPAPAVSNRDGGAVLLRADDTPAWDLDCSTSGGSGNDCGGG